MQEADTVVTLERRLDFQVAYGSRAVFAADARFVRIGPPGKTRPRTGGGTPGFPDGTTNVGGNSVVSGNMKSDGWCSVPYS